MNGNDTSRDVLICTLVVSRFVGPKIFITIFYVLFTVHPSIIIDNDQRDTHLLYFYNIFITFLYMFRALYAHHQEVELY